MIRAAAKTVTDVTGKWATNSSSVAAHIRESLTARELEGPRFLSKLKERRRADDERMIY